MNSGADSSREGSAETEHNSDLLQNVLDTIPIVVFWKDLNCVYVGANLEFAQKAGFNTVEELVGKTDFDCAWIEEAELYRKDDMEVMTSGIPRILYEEPQTRPDGTKLWLRTSKIPRRNSSGKVIACWGPSRTLPSGNGTSRKSLYLNDNLERQVEERTRELKTSNERLSETLQALHAAQDELVQAEKMASLGGLVSGVAHEVNTPVGISITACSHVNDMLGELRQKFDDGTMRRSDLETFLQNASENCSILQRNLVRAAELISSFKQVAVDQSSEQSRSINLMDYVNGVVLNHSPQLKKTAIGVEVDIADNIDMQTFPGAISQILSNLLINAMTHAFEPNEKGLISVDARIDADIIRLNFADNGAGMESEVISKVFEPFFTTKRGQGGTVWA